MRNDILRELMDNVESADLEAGAKAVIRQLIFNLSAQHGIAVFDRDEQIAFVHHLLRNLKEPRSVIRDRLIARFGLSRSTAYERIDEALQLSEKPALVRTEDWCNTDS